MKHLLFGILWVGGFALLFFLGSKLVVFLMTIKTVYLLILLGAILVVIFAVVSWLASDDDFEPPTLTWHDNNRVLHEINDKLKDK